MPNSNHYRQDAYVLCPYYCKEAPVEIKCLGICGSHTVNIFESRKAKVDFKEDFCCGNYKACPLSISLYMDEK